MILLLPWSSPNSGPVTVYKLFPCWSLQIFPISADTKSRSLSAAMINPIQTISWETTF